MSPWALLTDCCATVLTLNWVKQTLFCSDNVDTDIYGANLYNNYLKAVRGSNISKLLAPLYCVKEHIITVSLLPSQQIAKKDQSQQAKSEKTFQCLISQNGQAHFKNLAIFAARFLKCFWTFWDIMHEMD